MSDDQHCTMSPRCGLLEDSDRYEGGECVHCECCCDCLGCEYGPRNGMLMFPDGGR